MGGPRYIAIAVLRKCVTTVVRPLKVQRRKLDQPATGWPKRSSGGWCTTLETPAATNASVRIASAYAVADGNCVTVVTYQAIGRCRCSVCAFAT